MFVTMFFFRRMYRKLIAPIPLEPSQQ